MADDPRLLISDAHGVLGDRGAGVPGRHRGRLCEPLLGIDAA